MRARLLLWLLRVKVLRPEPGDLIVVRVPTTLRSEQIVSIRDAFRSVLPIGVKCVVLTGKMSLDRIAATVADRSPPAE